MIAANAEHRAFNLRSLLWRSGPWVSDGIWIAHHSLKLFGRVHQYLPSDGWWRLTESGPVAQDVAKARGLRLADITASYASTRRPCVVVEHQAPATTDIDEAMTAAVDFLDILEVIDERSGDTLTFDAQIAFAGCTYEPGWSWMVGEAIGDVHGTGRPLLIGLDRKERPRFFLCQTIAKSDGASS